MLDAIVEALKNKIVSAVGAGSLVVSAEATKSHYINLSESGFLMLTFASWMQIIGCLWITILILEKLGLFKLIQWVYRSIKSDDEPADH